MVSGLSAFVDGASSVRSKDGSIAKHRVRKNAVSNPSADNQLTTLSSKSATLVDMSDSSTTRPEISGVASLPTDAEAKPLSPGSTSVVRNIRTDGVSLSEAYCAPMWPSKMFGRPRRYVLQYNHIESSWSECPDANYRSYRNTRKARRTKMPDLLSL